MSFLRRLFNREPSTVCPYCSAALEQPPKRKKKCPHCGQHIYVRKGELLTEDQARLAKWLNRLDELGIGREEFEKDQKGFKEKHGFERSTRDTLWGLFNKHILECSAKADWNSYRRIRFEMAELLSEEQKYEDALSTYLEVCYLDLNDYGLAPGVVQRAKKIVKRLSLDPETTRDIYDYRFPEGYAAKGTLSSEQAWTKIKEELFEE